MELKIVDIETANLLYDIGFVPTSKESCYVDGTFCPNYDNTFPEGHPSHKEIIAAPTQELSKKFLREKHNIHIQMGLQDRMNPQMNSSFEFQGYSPILIIFYESGRL